MVAPLERSTRGSQGRRTSLRCRRSVPCKQRELMCDASHRERLHPHVDVMAVEVVRVIADAAAGHEESGQLGKRLSEPPQRLRAADAWQTNVDEGRVDF